MQMAEKDSFLFWPLLLSSAWLSENDRLRAILVAVIVLGIPFLFNYLILVLMYHWAHYNGREEQLPPEYPVLVPYLRSGASLLYDTQHFFHRAT